MANMNAPHDLLIILNSLGLTLALIYRDAGRRRRGNTCNSIRRQNVEALEVKWDVDVTEQYSNLKSTVKSLHTAVWNVDRIYLCGLYVLLLML